jgi:hypothetical protein
MFRAALFESGYCHAMFGDARRGKVNQNPPPKMSRIYREDRSMLRGGPKTNVFGARMSNHCVIPIDENDHLYSRLDRHTEP